MQASRALAPAFLLLLALSSCGGSAPSVAPHGAPWAAGAWIRDPQGRVLLLHGINVSHAAKRPPYLPFSLRPVTDAVTRASFDRIRGFGFNAVRLVLVWAALEPAPGVVDRGALDQIRREVELAGASGLWVLADMHQDLWGEPFCYGDGAPVWASALAGYDPDQCVYNNEQSALPLWGLDYGINAVQDSFQAFWTDAPGPDGVGLEEHYARAFAAVARAISGEPNLLGYDLMNEPYPGRFPLTDPVFEDDTLAPFYEKVGRALHAVDPVHPLFVEPSLPLGTPGMGYRTGGAMGRLDPGRGGVVFAPHFYPSDPNDASAVGPGLDRLALASRALALPWVVGEFGTNYASVGSAPYLVALLEGFDRHLGGWFNWSYETAYEPGIHDTTRPSMSPVHLDGSLRWLTDAAGGPAFPGLDVLSRPYPIATAGTPVRLRYPITNDPSTFTTTPFTYVYDEDGIGHGTTDLYLPERHFPQGFAVEVSDGTVRFDPAARLLRYVRGDRSRHEIVVTPCGGAAPGCLGF